jgi:hypothetical protein
MKKERESWRSPGENFSGLKWHGRKNGVSKWRGTWRKGPPLGFCRFFLVLTALLGLAGVTTLTLGLLKSLPALVASPALLLASLVYGVITWLSYRQRGQFLGLHEAEILAAEMGMTAEELERLVEEKDIKPKIYFNDVPLYSPEDLIQAKILLRPSSEPVTSETLLRAAAPAESTTDQAQLLRATKN